MKTTRESEQTMRPQEAESQRQLPKADKPAFPSDEAFDQWTMLNNSPLFDDGKAEHWFKKHEAEFDKDTDEFLDSMTRG